MSARTSHVKSCITSTAPHYFELSMSSHTEILCVITGDDALKASSGVSSSAARCRSSSVSRAAKPKYLLPPLLLPHLSSASLTLFLPRHLQHSSSCPFVHAPTSQVRAQESPPKSLLPPYTQKPL